MKKLFVFLAAVVLVGAPWSRSAGQVIPAPMDPPRLVNDFAGLFSAQQARVLEDSLVAFDRATSTQIAVVTVNDLGGTDASTFATKLLTKWGVGRKGKDNGVVLLLKPRNENGPGQVFIATGYGVEGALPDITAGRIIDYRMMSHLRNGDYSEAAKAGVKGIMEAVRGEFNDKDEGYGEEGSIAPFIGPLVLLAFIIVLFVRIGRKGGGSGGRRTVFFPPVVGGGSARGGWSGGGGFGGFGGGSGGGGGAGRSF